MEVKETIRSLSLSIAIVVSTLVAVFTYRVIETQKNATLQQQQFSLAVQSISNVKPEMQSVYIISLGTYGKPAIPVLLRLMGAPADSPAYSGAGIALQVMGEDALSEVLGAAQNNSLPTEYRKAAIAGLGKIGGKKSMEVLLKLAENRSEVNLLREQAMKSLLNYSNIENLGTIWKLLETEDRTSGKFYQAIFDVLFDVAARIAATRSVELPSNVRATIAKGLESKKNDVRYFAVKLIGAMRDTSYNTAIEKIAQTDTVDFVKKEAVEGLTILKQQTDSPK